MRKTRALRKLSGWRLLPTISIWVVLAIAAVVAVFLSVTWLFGGGECYPWSRPSEMCGDRSQAKALDSLKIALTVIGGIGAVPYLIIKYRERASVERDEADAKLLSAVQQLGSESPQVRIAGVYALADVADKYQGDYKQRVVDVLCGYLRTERGEWQTILDRPTNAEHHKEQYSHRYVSKDGAVESTILSVFARHMRARKESTIPRLRISQEVPDDQLWNNCHIDIHGAHIAEEVNLWGITCAGINATDTIFGSYFTLSKATIKRYAEFRRCSFAEKANFFNVTFDGACSFKDSEMKGETIFRCAKFAGDAWFGSATFQGGASFNGSTFRAIVHFEDTNFKGSVDFSGAEFSDVYRYTDGNVYPQSNGSDESGRLPLGAAWVHFDEN